MEKAYKNLGYFFLLLVPLAFLGFYKRYLSQFPEFQETTTYIHIHAAIASIWLFMLIIQPFLIRNRKYKQHRIVGRISYFVFPLLILSFILESCGWQVLVAQIYFSLYQMPSC
jgi:hypothetical protein